MVRDAGCLGSMGEMANPLKDGIKRQNIKQKNYITTLLAMVLGLK